MKNNLIALLIVYYASAFAQTATNNYSINGVFIHSQDKYWENNQLKSNGSVAAFFTYTPTLKIQPSAFSPVTRVKYNERKLKYKNADKFYSKVERVPHNNNSDDDDEENEECNGIDFNTKHWKVFSQNQAIPSLNFIYNGTLPTFSITNTMIRDTLKKSDTLFLNINNIQNADSIRVTFADNDQLQTRHYATFVAPNYTNRYYIKPSVFAPLVAGPRAFIKIDVVNYSYQTIGGKQFLFRNITSFTKANIRIIN